jgi:hypothetical protein
MSIRQSALLIVLAKVISKIIKISMKVLHILFALFSLLFVFGCNPGTRTEIVNAETELELAQSNSDLEAMFSAARTLSELDPENSIYQESVTKYRSDLTELNRIRILKVSNDPDLISAAQDFLKEYPTHREMVQVVTEAKAKLLEEEAESKRKRQEFDGKIQSLLARIELSEKTFDFSSSLEAFSNLSLLRSLSVEEKALEAKIQGALEVHLKMMAARGERDHESAVFNACRLLDIYPSHPKAKDILQTSGYLFILLEEVMELSESVDLKSFNADSEDFDLALNQANILAKASSKVKQALDLDPYFSASRDLDNQINSTRTIMGQIIAEREFNVAMTYCELLDKVWVSSWNATNSSFKNSSRYSTTGWDYYNLHIAESLKKMREIADDRFSDLPKKLQLIKELQTEESSEYIRVAIDFLDAVSVQVESYLKPSGTVKEWGDAGSRARSYREASYKKFQASYPPKSETEENFKQLIKFQQTFQIFRQPDLVKPELEKKKNLIKQA